MSIDEAVTYLYRMFKDWSKRSFTADDVTWCEVKGALEKVFKDKDLTVQHLEQRLKETETALRFYGSAENWKYPGNDFADFYIDWSDLSNTERKNSKGKVALHKCGGKRARAYFKKYGEKEEV